MVFGIIILRPYPLEWRSAKVWDSDYAHSPHFSSSLLPILESVLELLSDAELRFHLVATYVRNVRVTEYSCRLSTWKLSCNGLMYGPEQMDEFVSLTTIVLFEAFSCVIWWYHDSGEEPCTLGSLRMAETSPPTPSDELSLPCHRPASTNLYLDVHLRSFVSLWWSL